MHRVKVLSTVPKRKEDDHNSKDASGAHQPRGTTNPYLDPYFSSEKPFLRELGELDMDRGLTDVKEWTISLGILVVL